MQFKDSLLMEMLSGERMKCVPRRPAVSRASFICSVVKLQTNWEVSYIINNTTYYKSTLLEQLEVDKKTGFFMDVLDFILILYYYLYLQLLLYLVLREKYVANLAYSLVFILYVSLTWFGSTIDSDFQITKFHLPWKNPAKENFTKTHVSTMICR